MTNLPLGHKFDAGKARVTEQAMRVLQQEGHTPAEFLSRHVAADWGDHDAAQKQQNDAALENNGPLHSIYHTNGGEEIWVFTDADRSITTILLPQDYQSEGPQPDNDETI
jgi:hypothetical protein